jgi:N-acetylglucosaminyldiphosphoundecaprenol N-acetyl-beta-D-mannosaminyltransferase
MSDKVNILGVYVDMVNITQAADKIMEFLDSDGLHKVYTPNSEIIMAAYKDSGFKELLNGADLLTADGIGVVYASKILKKPISERAAGYDIACEVLERIKDTEHSVYLFGGKPGVAEAAEENLKKRYPGIKVAGRHDGYFKPEDETGIVEDINNSGADLLFVCLGAPKQEQWIARNENSLNVRAAMGIGGSLDVFAGTALRAPKFFCDHGLEWFYRLMKQPSRAGRMLALPKFAATVLIKGRKFE